MDEFEKLVKKMYESAATKDISTNHKVVVEFIGDDATTAKITESDAHDAKSTAQQDAALIWAACMDAAKALQLSDDDADSLGREINAAATKIMTRYAINRFASEILKDD